MKKIHLRLLFVLLFFLSCCLMYSIYRYKSNDTQQTINLSIIDVSSTKEWQDTISVYINKRNEIINEVLEGKYDNNKKWVAELKQLECAPLLYGDISLIEYMSKNRGHFTNKINSMKVEYNIIRQLTKDEVIMDTKISFIENNIVRNYNYEVMFSNIDGRWMLSKFAFAE